jgi:hypothetical protein
MCSEITIYQDEKQWIAWRLSQMVTAHGCKFGYYKDSTKMQHANLERILGGPTNMKVNTLFALLGSVEAGLPDLIEIPQLRHKIRSLTEEMKFVGEYNKALHLKKCAANV